MDRRRQQSIQHRCPWLRRNVALGGSGERTRCTPRRGLCWGCGDISNQTRETQPVSPAIAATSWPEPSPSDVMAARALGRDRLLRIVARLHTFPVRKVRSTGGPAVLAQWWGAVFQPNYP